MPPNLILQRLNGGGRSSRRLAGRLPSALRTRHQLPPPDQSKRGGLRLTGARCRAAIETAVGLPCALAYLSPPARSPTEGGQWPKRVFRRNGSRLRFQNRPISARLIRRRPHLSLRSRPWLGLWQRWRGGGNAVARLGVGYLPCMLGDITPCLMRVVAVEPELNDELWLLTIRISASQDEYTRS